MGKDSHIPHSSLHPRLVRTEEGPLRAEESEVQLAVLTSLMSGHMMEGEIF